MKPYAIRRKALTILIFVAVALIRSQPAAQIPTYDVTDLNTIGGGRSAALGVNNAGEVVGYSEAPMVASTHFSTAAGRCWISARSVASTAMPIASTTSGSSSAVPRMRRVFTGLSLGCAAAR